jgi:serine/threonine-protein kinase RsbW
MEAFFRRAQVGESHKPGTQLAVEELFTNLVKYSKGGHRDIRIEMSRDGDRLIVRLTDFDVEPFDIRTVPDARTDLSLAERKPGGLGIHLVKRLVDRIDYEYADRNSTTTFVKNLE